MRTALLALLSLLVGCASLPRPLPAPAGGGACVQLIESRVDGSGFSVRLQFSSSAPVLVQELDLGGWFCVECFRLECGRYTVDHHFSAWPQRRVMAVYPGEVEGADFTTAGFAMLEENAAGRKTIVAADFNVDYRRRHKIQGRVKRADLARATWWTLSFDGVNVTLAGVAPPTRNA